MLNNSDPIAIVKRLKMYNDAYRNGSPLIADAEYDALVERLRRLDSSNEYLNIVEPENFIDDRKKIKHPSPMLSTKKAYSTDAIKAWVCIVEKASISIYGTDKDITLRVTPKVDGIAARKSGDEFVTRGDGNYGRDISDAWDKGLIAIGGDGLGEIAINKKFFDSKMKNMAKHPRNIVAGMIGAKTLSDAAKFALGNGMVFFVNYDKLNCWHGSPAALLSDFEDIIKRLENECEFNIDGWVIESTDDKIKKHLGSTNHHQRYQIAYKRNAEAIVATVNGIVWQTGRTGKITPVLEIEPVEVSGAMISRVTAHHAGMVLSKRLGPNAQITIIRSGEVIPKVENVILESDDVSLPDRCPACGGNVEFENDFLMCVNDSCEEKAARRIIHWFKTIGNADNFGPKAVEKIVLAGFISINEVYSLVKSDFEKMGFGPTQSTNLEMAINNSINNKIEDWRFLAAFGIKHLGIGESKKVLEGLSINDILEIKEDELLKIPGFGPISAKEIPESIDKNRDVISAMLKLGFNLSVPSKVSGILSGKTIVFTGKSLKSRDEMKSLAESFGGTVTNSISKNTDMLVCGDNVGKSKTDKATKLGVKIISEGEFLEILK